MIVNITEQEAKDIKKIRNYFGENDKTAFEHMAYSVLDGLVKKLDMNVVSKVKRAVCDSDCPYWGYQCNINEMRKECTAIRLYQTN